MAGDSMKVSNLKFNTPGFWLSMILLLAGCNAWGREIQVEAEVSSETVGMEDQFQLVVTVTGSGSGDAQTPRIPPLTGLRVVAGPNVSSQFQWINGRTRSTKRFAYTLIPEREGRWAIDPIEVRLEDKLYRTSKIAIQVIPASGSSSSVPPGRAPDPADAPGDAIHGISGERVFLRAEADRASAYPGQQITITHRLYTRTSITGVHLQGSPSAAGFWVEDLEIDPRPKGLRQIIDGREYQVFAVKKQALFATATGRLKIPACTYALSVRNDNDFFGVFGHDETLRRRTQDLYVEIRPLPETGRPDNFSNAIGIFSLGVDSDKTEAVTGEAIALRVKLSGRGNLKMIPDIPLPPLPDFTVFPSRHEDATHPSAQGVIEGDKTWKYVLVPKTPGHHTLPPLTFSYFNPENEHYETARSAPLSLTIARGPESDALTGAESGERQNLIRVGKDIHPIQPYGGRFQRRGATSGYPVWVYLILAALLAANIGAFLHRKRHEALSRDPEAARRRTAKRNAENLLKQAEKEARAHSRRFYDLAAQTLSGYLKDRFGLPEIALTADQLTRNLAVGGVPESLADETHVCLQECDFGRFAGGPNSAETMLALSARIRSAISALERAANSGKEAS